MGLRHEHEEDYSFSDFPIEEEREAEELSHKRQVRKLLEEKLERKRLKEEFDELDGDFNWDDFEDK
ncbi:MAG: hypothetical protein LCH30_09315 [Proteobacteria bacterium]|nr:hypothetical protein [Pseudomonadota bacterium]